MSWRGELCFTESHSTDIFLGELQPVETVTSNSLHSSRIHKPSEYLQEQVIAPYLNLLCNFDLWLTFVKVEIVQKCFESGTFFYRVIVIRFYFLS